MSKREFSGLHLHGALTDIAKQADDNQITEKFLRKQRMNLYSKGKQLIDQLIYLHDLGVHLEICPPDPHFSEILSTANGRLASSFQLSGSGVRLNSAITRVGDGHYYEAGAFDGDVC